MRKEFNDFEAGYINGKAEGRAEGRRFEREQTDELMRLQRQRIEVLESETHTMSELLLKWCTQVGPQLWDDEPVPTQEQQEHLRSIENLLRAAVRTLDLITQRNAGVCMACGGHNMHFTGCVVSQTHELLGKG